MTLERGKMVFARRNVESETASTNTEAGCSGHGRGVVAEVLKVLKGRQTV